MNSLDKIDIVIPWVDPSDPEWRSLKKKYSPQVTSEDDDREMGEERRRDGV